MALRDDEPKEGGAYARYGWSKGWFMFCVEPTLFRAVLTFALFDGYGRLFQIGRAHV